MCCLSPQLGSSFSGTGAESLPSPPHRPSTSKLQRESIDVWETISLHPLLGKLCLDQMTGGCCVPIPGMSRSSGNTGHLSMAWSWFDGSGGAPEGWGPGWKRRWQSEKREGDIGQQSCGGLRQEPGEGSLVELGQAGVREKLGLEFFGEGNPGLRGRVPLQDGGGRTLGCCM